MAARLLPCALGLQSSEGPHPGAGAQCSQDILWIPASSLWPNLRAPESPLGCPFQRPLHSPVALEVTMWPSMRLKNLGLSPPAPVLVWGSNPVPLLRPWSLGPTRYFLPVADLLRHPELHRSPRGTQDGGCPHLGFVPALPLCYRRLSVTHIPQPVGVAHLCLIRFFLLP